VSGAGKDSLMERMLVDFPQYFYRAVSHTTRVRREQEVSGVTYHYVSHKEFDALIQADEFVEHVVCHGNKYGISKRALADPKHAGKSPLLIVEYHGLAQLRLAGYNPFAILVKGPKRAELEQRLLKRKDDPATIAIRMKTAEDELLYYAAHPEAFDLTIDNSGDFHTAYTSLRAHVLELFSAQ
jgi:guanylate kinase